MSTFYTENQFNSNGVLRLIEYVVHGGSPRLREDWINDWRSKDPSRLLHEASRANSKNTIGAVVALHRRWEYPSTEQFVERYLHSGDEFDARIEACERPNPHEYGRSAEHLSRIVTDLTSYCRKHPNFPHATYDFTSVGEWFLHLLFVRTLEGGMREGRVWRLIGGSLSGWRPSTAGEDSNEGLDFIHIATGNVLQVKPLKWAAKATLREKWLKSSAPHGNRRWLVQCDHADHGTIVVYSIQNGELFAANVADLQAIGNETNRGNCP